MRHNQSRRNYLQEKYKELNDSDLWKLCLCSGYASERLLTKYSPNSIPIHITATELCLDKRRIPTVRRYLESLNLIKSGYSTENTLEPISEEIEKLLPSVSIKEPEFNTTGYIETGSYSFDKKLVPISDLGVVYRNIINLNAYEIIYIYLNQNKFDFKEFKHIYYSKQYINNTITNITYKLKVFPLNAINSSSVSSINAVGETFAKSHAREILTTTFKLKFKAIDDSKDYLSKEILDSRIQSVEDKIRLLQRTRKELLVLKTKATTLGDENFKKDIVENSIKYLKHKAPLWINEKDKEKKNLAILFCKGLDIQTERSTYR